MNYLKNFINYYRLKRVLVIGTKENSENLLSKLKNNENYYLLNDTAANESDTYDLCRQAHIVIITTHYEKENVYENLFNLNYGMTYCNNFLRKDKPNQDIYIYINNDIEEKDLMEPTNYYLKTSTKFCLYRVQICNMKIKDIILNNDDIFKKLS